MKFEIKKDRGALTLTFTDEDGESCSTRFNGPPENIDHVDIEYLVGRFWNVGSKVHVDFIKAEYKKQIQNFPEFLMDEINTSIKGKITNNLAIISVDFYENGVTEIKFSDGESMITDYTYSFAHLDVDEDEMWNKQ